MCVYMCVALSDIAMVVETAGGIEMVIASMRRHIDNDKVQYQGCVALENIASSPGTIDAFVLPTRTM